MKRADGLHEPTGLVRAFVVSVPSLATYPLKWLVDNTSPPDPLWYFADRFGWIFLASPLSLIAFLLMWRGFRPRAPWHHVVFVLLLLLNIFVVLTSLAIFSMIFGGFRLPR
jgi:hypothetical protein